MMFTINKNDRGQIERIKIFDNICFSDKDFGYCKTFHVEAIFFAIIKGFCPRTDLLSLGIFLIKNYSHGTN